MIALLCLSCPYVLLPHCSQVVSYLFSVSRPFFLQICGRRVVLYSLASTWMKHFLLFILLNLYRMFFLKQNEDSTMYRLSLQISFHVRFLISEFFWRLSIDYLCSSQFSWSYLECIWFSFLSQIHLQRSIISTKHVQVQQNRFMQIIIYKFL
jgi:hypothetical protein